MFKNIEQMKRDKTKKIKEARELLDNAQDERRSLTSQEESRYNDLIVEAKNLEKEIPLEEERQQAEMKGDSVRATIDDKGREIPLLTHEERMADHVRGRTPDGLEPSTVTTGRLIRGMVSGWDGLEAERRALVGAEDPQGGYMLPDSLSSRFIDLARARMVLSQAGAVTVPVEADSLKIPKLLADPTPYWRGELEDIDTSDPNFGAVVLKPKTVAILTLVSHEVWEDAMGLGEAVETALSKALANEIDRVGLVGGGAGNANEPIGIYYTDGINTVEMDTNGAVPADYDKFLDAIKEIEENNGSPATAIYSPRTKRTLAGLVTGISDDKTKLQAPEEVKNLRKLLTTAVPNDLDWGSSTGDTSAAFVGGFNNVYMGMRQQVRIDVSPHGSGVFDKLGLWVRAFARVDFAVVRPGELCRITGIKDQ